MSTEITGYYILGITTYGNSFRPSDWVERIASVYGTFENERHLKYHPMIKPARYENNRCLFIDSQLSELKPEIFKHIMDFASVNSLRIEVKNPLGINKKSVIHYQKVA